MSHEAPRRVDMPEPGLYQIKQVRGGVFIAARIQQHPNGTWQATIDGRDMAPVEDWAVCQALCRIHFGGRHIAQREYDYLLERKAWAEKNREDHPCLDPRTPVDLGRMKSLW